MRNINYLNILEFNRIKEMLLFYAATDFAKSRIDALEPIMNELALKRAMSETSGARAILNFAGNLNLPNVAEAKSALEIAEKDGLVYPEQLEKFAKFAAACRRTKDYLKKAEKTEAVLAYIGREIDTLDEPFSEINRCITGGTVVSSASKVLADIMRQIDNTNVQIRAKLDEMLKGKKQYFSDGFVSVRNGHFTLPVKREYKNMVSGSTIDFSSTGTTVFIEPSAIVKLNEKLNLLKTERDIETEKILYALTATIWRHGAEIKRNIEAIEALDFAFAKGKLSSAMGAVEPTILTERRIKIEQGRHPLLNRDVCVPLDFEIGGDYNGVIVTGPNTGGKTVALKLVGLFSAMAQSGLHVPAKNAEIAMNGNILCDIGDGQNISENLSTFSAHITNITDILTLAGKQSLVLLDELGSGTDPAEGMGIAVAIIEELRRRGCLFVATTHYAAVKHYAENVEGLINARMTFDKETLKPEYHLIIGEAGESCALYIAKRLGFPEHLLKLAYETTYSDIDIKTKPEGGFIELLSENADKPLPTVSAPKIERAPQKKVISAHAASFSIGDSVTVYPEKKIGIVYQPADNMGFLVIQLRGRKVKVNHKRVKLKTPASELYPPDYDFSIIFDSVENRKARHDMDRGFFPDAVIEYEKVE